MNVALPWSDFFSWELSLAGRTLPWDGWGLGQKGCRSPWLQALSREWDAGWAPSTGCLVLTDDGMLGAGPLLLAGAM